MEIDRLLDRWIDVEIDVSDLNFQKFPGVKPPDLRLGSERQVLILSSIHITYLF